MVFALEDSVLQVFEQVRQATQPGTKVYLVGGAIRDILMNRPNHDLDFCVEEDAIRLAKTIANQVGGGVFVLDSERETARVLVSQPGKNQLFIDFAKIRGGSLLADLSLRDFTINAIALDLNHQDEWIDPFHGAKDIREGVLRECSSTSFIDDPIRVLRAVRMATGFNLHMGRETVQLLKDSVSQIGRVSGERLRDEIFKIFEGGQTAKALRIMERLGILKEMLPEFNGLIDLPQPSPHQYDGWTHTIKTIEGVERILSVVTGGFDAERVNDLNLGLAVMRLGRFREVLTRQYQKQLSGDRPLRGILKFGGLYHDIGKPSTYSQAEDGVIHFYNHENLGSRIVGERGRALALSNQEIERVEAIVRGHMRPHQFARDPDGLTNRAIYRFFKDTGEAGIDICILALADTWATYGTSLPLDVWTKELDVCQRLMTAFFDIPKEVVHPTRLLTGNDLMTHLSISSGPLIGQLLEAIREGQAAGEISTREQAFEFANEWLIARNP